MIAMKEKCTNDCLFLIVSALCNASHLCHRSVNLYSCFSIRHLPFLSRQHQNKEHDSSLNGMTQFY